MKVVNENKDARIIGYKNAQFTQDIVEVAVTLIPGEVVVIEPEEFFALENKDKYQYFVGVCLDLQERAEIIKVLDELDLECMSYINENCEVHPGAKIGKGTAIFSFNTIMHGAVIGDHCMIDAYCLVAHNTTLGSNCILHPGTMIAGKTVIGNNCLFNFRSSVLNSLTICDNVVVGAFTNVRKDIPEPGVYVGTSARRLTSSSADPLGHKTEQQD
jgi:UDP-3-O-[3-hydroxymyristoyl] glucosamine N-acyltransferase